MKDILAKKRKLIKHIANRIWSHGPAFLADFTEASVDRVLHVVSTEICDLERGRFTARHFRFRGPDLA